MKVKVKIYPRVGIKQYFNVNSLFFCIWPILFFYILAVSVLHNYDSEHHIVQFSNFLFVLLVKYFYMHVEVNTGGKNIQETSQLDLKGLISVSKTVNKVIFSSQTRHLIHYWSTATRTRTSSWPGLRSVNVTSSTKRPFCKSRSLQYQGTIHQWAAPAPLM